MSSVFAYDPSDAEWEILQAIWALQPVTVRGVYERIAEKKDVGYTTVLKQMQRLTEKGILEKDAAEGAHLYRSKLPEMEAKSQFAQKVLHTAFGGSTINLLLHALGNDESSVEELKTLKAWLDQQTGI